MAQLEEMYETETNMMDAALTAETNQVSERQEDLQPACIFRSIDLRMAGRFK